MRTGIAIKSIANSLDGLHASVIMSGTANGAITFQASRTPDMALGADVPVSGEWPIYTLTFPAPVLWWITATDSTNATASSPVWVSKANDEELNLCGKQLETILEANRAALDLALQMSIPTPGMKWKQIAYGSGTIVRDFPAILITKAKFNAVKVAFPFTWDESYTFEIFAIILHQDRTSYQQAAATIAGRIKRLLNQPAYFALMLPSGTIVNNCTCAQGDADDVQLDETGTKFGAIASVLWRGDGLLMDSMSQVPS